MGRWLLLIIVVIIGAAPAVYFGIVTKIDQDRKDAISAKLRPQREAAYQSALQSYSKQLRPGLTREDVEEYLQTKGVVFRQMCCLGKGSAYSDLVKIGWEKPPWYSSENYVYIAFEFSGTSLKPDVTDADLLEKTSIYRQLWGCL